jgi:hypothetical protein
VGGGGDGFQSKRTEGDESGGIHDQGSITYREEHSVCVLLRKVAQTTRKAMAVPSCILLRMILNDLATQHVIWIQQCIYFLHGVNNIIHHVNYNIIKYK